MYSQNDSLDTLLPVYLAAWQALKMATRTSSKMTVFINLTTQNDESNSVDPPTPKLPKSAVECFFLGFFLLPTIFTREIIFSLDRVQCDIVQTAAATAHCESGFGPDASKQAQNEASDRIQIPFVSLGCLLVRIQL